MTNWLGVDFGTSNSAAAYFSDGKVVNIELEPGRNMIPTAVFFDFHEREILLGTAANKALIDGLDGRYMRSLKSVLGTSLMSEKRPLLGRRTDFYDIITVFLRQLKSRAEKSTGQTFDHVVSGRPVFFHDGDPQRDQAAQNDLETCYLRAGFSSVKFLFEPVAAAFANAGHAHAGTIGLVVDIGGGTSDFTLFRTAAANCIDVLASNGLRLGGTNFDRQISFDHFMPLLGRGQKLKRRLPDGIIEAPTHIFAELSTWEKIPFQYDPKNLLFAQGLLRDAVEPQTFSRLVKVLEMRLGHDIAFLAEKTKISYNRHATSQDVDLGIIEPDLYAPLSQDGFEQSLARFTPPLAAAIQEILDNAKIPASNIGRVVTVGGSSSMHIVTDAIRHSLPDLANLEIEDGAIFTSVVDGLAIAASQQ